MLIRFHILLMLTACVLPFTLAHADAPAPPPSEVERDSVAARWEEGAELTRWLGTARLDVGEDSTTRIFTRLNWVTGLTRGQSTDGRVRHDARWVASAARPLSPKMKLWGGATGQHYIDRPRSNSTSAQENRSQVIRSGVGPAVQWTKFLSTTHSIGALLDARDGQSDEGVGTWNSGEFEYTDAHNRHTGSVSYDYERPGDREGNDAGLAYKLQQDFNAASNTADIQIGWTRRDLMTAPTLPPQLREEKSLRFADELHYEVAKGAILRGIGDLRYSDTRLDDRRGSASRLEELESGLGSELEVRHDQHIAAVSAKIHTASQNVRGEILAGRKVELAARGETEIGMSRLNLRTAFSKYTLDTRSDQNFDDRDELGWRFESGMRTKLSPTLESDVQALVDLNHLVYIFSKNSANNRWTRLFLLTTRFIHTPSRTVTHVPAFRISANYQDYDFETNPRQVRSTVFRRLTIGDSVAVHMHERWTLSAGFDLSREELGRLYWAEFEEERSDQTDVVSAALECERSFGSLSTAALGLAYSRRAGDRYEQDKGAKRVQELESWGPTTRVLLSKGRWFCQGVGQWVMQNELGRADRNFISGSLTAGRAW
jgi:hypothetical protein